MEKPLVSILCLCYNQSAFVEESLNSIKNQTFTNFELLIIDDFSQKDNSVEVIENWILNNSDLSVTFIKHKVNKGICASLNELLSLSKGKYIQLLALDDLLYPWKIEKHVEILENSNENEALIFTDADLINDHSVKYQNKFIAYHKTYLSLETKNYLNELIIGNFIPALSVMFKSEIIKKINGWDESLAYEDYEMWLRLSSLGYDFIFSDIISCSYRLHQNNTHNNRDLFKADTFKFFLKYSNYPKIYDKLKNQLEFIYRSGELTIEHKLFFAKHKPTTFSDYLIKYKFPRLLYRTLKFFKL